MFEPSEEEEEELENGAGEKMFLDDEAASDVEADEERKERRRIKQLVREYEELKASGDNAAIKTLLSGLDADDRAVLKAAQAPKPKAPKAPKATETKKKPSKAAPLPDEETAMSEVEAEAEAEAEAEVEAEEEVVAAPVAKKPKKILKRHKEDDIDSVVIDGPVPPPRQKVGSKRSRPAEAEPEPEPEPEPEVEVEAEADAEAEEEEVDAEADAEAGDGEDQGEVAAAAPVKKPRSKSRKPVQDVDGSLSTLHAAWFTNKPGVATAGLSHKSAVLVHVATLNLAEPAVLDEIRQWHAKVQQNRKAVEIPISIPKSVPTCLEELFHTAREQKTIPSGKDFKLVAYCLQATPGEGIKLPIHVPGRHAHEVLLLILPPVGTKNMSIVVSHRHPVAHHEDGDDGRIVSAHKTEFTLPVLADDGAGLRLWSLSSILRQARRDSSDNGVGAGYATTIQPLSHLTPKVFQCVLFILERSRAESKGPPKKRARTANGDKKGSGEEKKQKKSRARSTKPAKKPKKKAASSDDEDDVSDGELNRRLRRSEEEEDGESKAGHDEDDGEEAAAADAEEEDPVQKEKTQRLQSLSEDIYFGTQSSGFDADAPDPLGDTGSAHLDETLPVPLAADVLVPGTAAPASVPAPAPAAAAAAVVPATQAAQAAVSDFPEEEPVAVASAPAAAPTIDPDDELMRRNVFNMFKDIQLRADHLRAWEKEGKRVPSHFIALQVAEGFGDQKSKGPIQARMTELLTIMACETPDKRVVSWDNEIGFVRIIPKQGYIHGLLLDRFLAHVFLTSTEVQLMNLMPITERPSYAGLRGVLVFVSKTGSAFNQCVAKLNNPGAPAALTLIQAHPSESTQTV